MSKEIKNVEYGLEKIFEGAQDFLTFIGNRLCRVLCGQC